MRRSDREIKDFDEIIKVMEKCDVCRIVLNDDEYPYVVPLNFGMSVEDKAVTLYFHSALEGKKIDLIKSNNKAAFEMDCGHELVYEEKNKNCTMNYESVIGQGTIEFVDDDEKIEALKILMAHYYSEEKVFNEKMVSHTAVFKLKVSEMTGKRRQKN